MNLRRDDFPKIIEYLNELAFKNNYSKIFAKVPEWARKCFEDAGYIEEAHIPKFFNKCSTVYFMAKYLDDKRKRVKNGDRIRDVLEVCKEACTDKNNFSRENSVDAKYSFRQAVPEDTRSIAELYKKVFETYPFPIHDRNYIRNTMRDNYMYFGIWDRDRLIAISSADIDFLGFNGEMTDFATLPDYRGEGLATYLLCNMETEISGRGIKTTYTIARAVSYGMNKVFARSNYKYGGTLINNTNISGELESMNVWYKYLSG